MQPLESPPHPPGVIESVGLKTGSGLMVRIKTGGFDKVEVHPVLVSVAMAEIVAVCCVLSRGAI